jgi:hypothetical protein
LILRRTGSTGRPTIQVVNRIEIVVEAVEVSDILALGVGDDGRIPECETVIHLEQFDNTMKVLLWAVDKFEPGRRNEPMMEIDRDVVTLALVNPV